MKSFNFTWSTLCQYTLSYTCTTYIWT